MSRSNAFQIEWDLRELGPKPIDATTVAAPASPYRDISAQMDFSRLDLGRAVAAGYAPADSPRARRKRAA